MSTLAPFAQHSDKCAHTHPDGFIAFGQGEGLIHGKLGILLLRRADCNHHAAPLLGATQLKTYKAQEVVWGSWTGNMKLPGEVQRRGQTPVDAVQDDLLAPSV